MDNDLMARRLRPPSEPISSQPLTGPMPPPSWMQRAPDRTPVLDQPQALDQPDVLDGHVAAQQQVLDRHQVPDQNQVVDQTQMPAARDEVPWDRPSDYGQPTDTASGGELPWDRPDIQAWDDSMMYDDRPPDMLEPEPEIYASMVAAATPSVSAVDENVASFTPAPAADVPTSAMAFDPVSDPDDAYAPVLQDVHTPPAIGWHEPTAQAEVPHAPPSRSPESGDFWAEAWQSRPATTEPTTQMSSFAPVEPSDLAGRGLGPTPPPELFTEAPSLWTAPPVGQPQAPEDAAQQVEFGQEVEFAQEPEFAEVEDDAPVGVTAEQAWQAYEAFGSEEDSSSSAAVLEIEVPQPAQVAQGESGKPQQLVLRIELAIVDGNGRQIDPANVAVRVSPIETAEASALQPAPAAEEAQPTQAGDEPPWPVDTQAAIDARLSDAPQWLEPEQSFGPETPSPVEERAPQPAQQAESAFTTLPPWSQPAPLQDPLSSLSAPPPPQSHQFPRPSPISTSNVAAPPFAPPTFAPPAATNQLAATASAASPAATTSDAATSAIGGEQREPRFRAPPGDQANDGDATATASESDARTAMWTLGVGVLVVALAGLFLVLLTNIL